MAAQIDHHAEMLSDKIRLCAFRDAIRANVKSGDVVVDIGAGLGPLTASALDAGASQVTAVEYVPELAALTAETIGEAPIQVVTGRSYDIELHPAPDVVVTETIGRTGPEENIVEITYDLKRRYPGLRRIIPQRMQLFARAIQSERAEAARVEVFAKLASSATGRFDPRRAQPA